MTTISVFAKVDIDDVLGAVGLDDTGKYLRSGLSLDERIKLAKAILAERPGEHRENDDGLTPYLTEALELLRAGRADDAELLLERAAHPKWRSAEAALLAFRGRA